MSSVIQVGDCTIHKIVEFEYPFVAALAYFPSLSEEVLAANREWLVPHALDVHDYVIHSFHAYVVQTPHHTILIDSCVGDLKDRARPEWHRKTGGTFLRSLAAGGFTPESIDYVMCTHLHSDHVGWNTQLVDGRWVPTFPRARYIFAQGEYDFWLDRHRSKPIACMDDSVLPIVEAKRAELVSGHHEVGDHLRLAPTPGHTPHHSAVYLGRDRIAAAFTGDLIHSPLQTRYPELSMRSDFDQAQAAVTRRSFLETCFSERALVCTAHFPDPSFGRLDRWDSGFILRALC